MSLIQTNTRTVVEGEWVSGWCGGPPSCGTWRNNPQFLLYPSEGMEVTVVLRQRNDLSSTEEHIGFTVHRAKDIRSILHYNAEDVVLSVSHENAHAVTGTVRLAGMQERRGMPYVIVPTTLKAHRETGFTLEIVANKKVHLEKVPAETNWRRVVVPVTFRFAERTAGGSLHFSSWRNNPQFLLKFPLEKQGKLLVSVSNNKPDGDQEVGIVCLKADSWDRGMRRKICLEKGDILEDAPARVGVSEFETTVTIKNDTPLILMPYLSAPLQEAVVTVSIYSSVDVEIEPVKEWNQYVVDGSWEIGNTAGGNRKENPSWINNPFFRLNCVKQSRVYIVLLQYPRGPEKLQAMLVAKQRVYLPPPITNDRRKLNIGFDLVEGNDEYTPIASTAHVYAGEVAMMRVMPACDREPYMIVPHSYDPEHDADFKVLVFSDEPIQVQEVNKARRYY